jgi:hypothetical protein
MFMIKKGIKMGTSHMMRILVQLEITKEICGSWGLKSLYKNIMFKFISTISKKSEVVETEELQVNVNYPWQKTPVFFKNGVEDCPERRGG